MQDRVCLVANLASFSEKILQETHFQLPSDVLMWVQVVKLLEEALRAQGPLQAAPPAFQQHSLPVEHSAQAIMGINALSYPSFAR